MLPQHTLRCDGPHFGPSAANAPPAVQPVSSVRAPSKRGNDCGVLLMPVGVQQKERVPLRQRGCRIPECCLTLCMAVLTAVAPSGCASPYHADRGALAGGLGGAGVGALIGNAVGHTGAGAAIGAGVGTLAGAAVGGALDDIEARNRAQIAAHLGRPVPAGVVTFDDVIAMTRAGVDEDLIVNHIRANGAARPPQAADLIMLQQYGVSKRVIAALQEPPAPPAGYGSYGAVPAAGPPVIIEEHHYGPPWAYWHPPPPHIGIGFSYSRHSRCR